MRYILCITILLFTSTISNSEENEKLKSIESMYQQFKKNFPNIKDISPKATLELSKSHKLVFVDVRKKQEQKISMIPGAINKVTFLKNKHNYRNAFIIPYCTIGYRSGLFTQELIKEQFNAHNLKGSILAWVHAGFNVKRNGKAVQEVHVYGPKWNLLPQGYKAIW